MTLIPKALNSTQRSIKVKLCMNALNSIETHQYHLGGYSISNFSKEKNGDDYRMTYLKSERLLVAVVSDGVSQQPCDWLASEIVSEGFIQVFSADTSDEEIESRIVNSVQQANKLLIEGKGDCMKMAATLSVCVIDEQSNMLYWVNIGDSRIYTVEAGIVRLITQDDVRKTKKTIQTAIGKRSIESTQLTRCMGHGRLNLSVNSKPLLKGEVIILASDGFYEARKASFQKKLLDFQQQENFVEAFAAMASSFEIMRDDDMTVVAIQRKHHQAWG